MERDVTVYRAIENSNGSIQLSDIRVRGEWCKEPALHFKEVEKEAYWDNTEYVLSLFRAIKNKKQTKEVKELEKFCLDNKMDFKTTCEELLDIYLSSKKLKFWKKKK